MKLLQLWFFLFLVLLLVFGSPLYADNGFPQLKVVPWNGHKAATSLTFDDGDRSQLDVAIPELNRRNLHATFFLIANKIDRKDEWRQALKAGHEIGNHTLDNLHANQLSPAQENAQVVGAQNVLQKEFGIPLYSFAYPFGEVSPGLKDWVAQTSFLARGRVPTRISPKDSTLDWSNLSSKTIMTNYSFKTYRGWINKSLKSGDWLVWTIHEVENVPEDSQSLALKTFQQILDNLQSKDIWVGTFTEVGSYLRAWKAFEAATVKVTDTGLIYTWSIPDHCPMNVTLKVKASQGNSAFELWQNGQKIVPDLQGNYPIVFNLGQLSLRR